MTDQSQTPSPQAQTRLLSLHVLCYDKFLIMFSIFFLDMNIVMNIFMIDPAIACGNSKLEN